MRQSICHLAIEIGISLEIGIFQDRQIFYLGTSSVDSGFPLPPEGARTFVEDQSSVNVTHSKLGNENQFIFHFLSPCRFTIYISSHFYLFLTRQPQKHKQ